MNPLQFFKCLADQTRLKCLLLIKQEGELCVCEITCALQDIQPKVSRHLAQLRKCGLLVDRRQGQWVFYRINSALPRWAHNVLEHTALSNAAFIAVDLARLCAMGDRPERAKACC